MPEPRRRKGLMAPFTGKTIDGVLYVEHKDFAQLQKKNQWLLDRLIDAEKLAWHFARKIDSTHTECVIADARLEMMNSKPVNPKSGGSD